jgi:hypothetical protein
VAYTWDLLALGQQQLQESRLFVSGPQFISPDQWQAVKNTVSALDGSEANDGPLPDWWPAFRDQLNRMIVCSTHPVEPYQVTEDFLWMLRQYLDGSNDQEQLGTGTRLVIEWAQGTLESAAALELQPVKGGDGSVWVVMANMERNDKGA